MIDDLLSLLQYVWRRPRGILGLLLHLFVTFVVFVGVIIFVALVVISLVPVAILGPFVNYLLHGRMLRIQLHLERKLTEVLELWPEIGSNPAKTTLDSSTPDDGQTLVSVIRQLSGRTAKEIQNIVKAHPKIEVRRLKDADLPSLIREATRELRRQYPEYTAEIPSLVPKLPGPKLLGILSAFKWFCSRANRDILEAIEADLRRDVKKMRKEGRKSGYIRTVLLWQIFAGSIIPIAWDGMSRALRKIAYVAKTVRQIRP